MNSLADFKGGKLMLVIGAIILGTIITGFFAFQSTKKGGTFQNAILTGITKTVSTGNNVSSAPIVLSQISGTRFLNKNIDDSKLIYNFQNTYEDVVTNKLIDAKTSSEFLSEPDKLKVMLLSSAPTNIEGTDGYIILNRDGGAKLGNMNFTKFQFKKQNERLKGLSVSAIAVGPFTEDEAKLMQKETFPVSELVPLDNSGKFILVVENQTNDVYQKAADVNIVGSNNSGNPKVQKDITAVIPATTIVNGQKHNILERVGEVLYQKNGSTTTKSLFDDGTSYTNYILRLTVILQDQIQATIESTESKICKNPNTHRLHNGHCVMLRPEDTPEHKDNLINQLTDEKNKLKDKVDKLKEKADKFDEADNDGTLMLGCITKDENSYNEDRVRRTRRRSNLEFANKDECGGLKKFVGYTKYVSKSSSQYKHWSNYFGFFFQEHKKFGNNIMNNLKSCRSYGGTVWVCEFNGNNDLKISELYLSTESFKGTAHCRYSKSRSRVTCSGGDGDFGTGSTYDSDSFVDINSNYISDFWGLFSVGSYQRVNYGVQLNNYRKFFGEYKKLITAIKKYVTTLSNDNPRGTPELNPENGGFAIIGVRYAEPKNYNGFLTDICIHKFGCYGVGKDAGNILTDNDGIQRIVDDGELRPGKYRQGTSSSMDGKKRWGRLYITNYDKMYKKDTKNPYELKDMLFAGNRNYQL